MYRRAVGGSTRRTRRSRYICAGRSRAEKSDKNMSRTRKPSTHRAKPCGANITARLDAGSDGAVAGTRASTQPAGFERATSSPLLVQFRRDRGRRAAPDTRAHTGRGVVPGEAERANHPGWPIRRRSPDRDREICSAWSPGSWPSTRCPVTPSSTTNRRPRPPTPPRGRAACARAPRARTTRPRGDPDRLGGA